MPLFISMLLTAGAAFWYYRTAERLGIKPIPWAVAGAIAYQVPAWVWMIMFSRPYLTGLRSTAAKTEMSSFLIGHSWIVVGAIATVLVYKFFLLKTGAGGKP
jgi:hypothetical protein